MAKQDEPLFFCDSCRAQIDGEGLCRDCMEEEEAAEDDYRCNEDYDRWDYYNEFGGEG